MRTIKIIFFNPSSQFNLLEDPSKEGMELVKVPLNYQLAASDILANRTVILLYYSDFGRQKLSELKKKFPKIPFIFLAKYADKKDLLQALRLGVSNFLFLPLKKKELRDAIENAIDSIFVIQPRKSLLERVHSFWIQTLGVLRILFFGGQRHSKQALDVLEIISPNSRLWMQDLSEELKTVDIQVKFFGNFELKVRGKKLPAISGHKNNAVLAFLLFRHEKSIHREELINAFWPKRSKKGGRNSLNVAICNIRKYFSKYLPGQEIILLEKDLYCFNPELEIVSDVEQFIKHWKKGRAIELSQGLSTALGAYHKALSYYDQDLLEEMHFEDWCESYRDNFKETYLFILNRLSTFFFQRKEYDACIAVCRRMLLKDACQEGVHRKLMECFYHLGMHDLARNQYFKCEKILSQELKIKPSGQTQKLYGKLGNA